MAGETHETDFALLFGCAESFKNAIRIVGLLRVVVIDD
jgi:hypothetical protein